MSDARTDVLGNPLTEVEATIMDLYERLLDLHGRDIAPSVKANVGEAISALWQAANDLALTDDRPVV